MKKHINRILLSTFIVNTLFWFCIALEQAYMDLTGVYLDSSLCNVNMGKIGYTYIVIILIFLICVLICYGAIMFIAKSGELKKAIIFGEKKHE